VNAIQEAFAKHQQEKAMLEKRMAGDQQRLLELDSTDRALEAIPSSGSADTAAQPQPKASNELKLAQSPEPAPKVNNLDDSKEQRRSGPTEVGATAKLPGDDTSKEGGAVQIRALALTHRPAKNLAEFAQLAHGFIAKNLLRVFRGVLAAFSRF
jgi:hypothetical protein